MRSALIALTLLLSLNLPQAQSGVMNSIHLETHEALDWFFHKRGEDFIGAYDMNFTDNSEGCTFTIGTRVVTRNAEYSNTTYQCRLCFVQSGRRSFDAQEIDCQQ